MGPSFFTKYPKIVATVADKAMGNMSFNWGDHESVAANRNKFFEQLNINPEQVVVASLVHGRTITEVTKVDWGKGIANREESIESDILVTATPDTFLFIVVADCLALFFFDPVKQVIALAHAGWRGIEQNVPAITIEYMVKNHGCKAEDILVGISPAQHYSTHPNLLTDKRFWAKYQELHQGKPVVNLIKAALDQLLAVGVLAEKIDDCALNTQTNTDYFSHRRSEETGEKEGRFGCVLGIKA